MIKGRMLVSICILFILLPIVFFGCGSREESGGEATSPSIQVSPSAFDFGIVTSGHTPAPLVVTITNNGSEGLNVFDISLSDTDNFALDLTGGSNPCTSASPILAVGGKCDSEVAFQPTQTGAFSATLDITSDDHDTPTFQLQLSGTIEELSSLNVTINQVISDKACPTATITAYVSVTDQWRFPVTGLLANNFTVIEIDVDMGDPTDVSFVNEVFEPISIALVMDNSGSMRNAGAIGPMNDAAVEFVNQLNPFDEVEVIKFATAIDVVQDFTSDKTALIAAIEGDWDGTGTALYDAVDLAITHTAARASERKAVLVITDGKEYGTSDTLLNELIDNAKSLGIPVFVIGLGDDIDIDSLEQITDETGGEYYGRVEHRRMQLRLRVSVIHTFACGAGS